MLDTPVYKVLAANDTAHAPGHQGGIVIPAGISDYFPDVEGTITEETPTADVLIEVEMFVASSFLGRTESRFQLQTWGAKRSPERRLTGGLGPIREAARTDDMILFSRDALFPDRILLTLLRKGDAEYRRILEENGNRRWGIVAGLPKPLSNSEVRDAETELSALVNAEFSLFDPARRLVRQTAMRKARDTAFRRLLLQAYGPNCLATGEAIFGLRTQTNLDAAHIVPVEAGGTDDLRNGLILSKDLHWAFDRGLFSFRDDWTVEVSQRALSSAACQPLKRINGRKVEFGNASIRPHFDAIKWHRQNRFI